MIVLFTTKHWLKSLQEKAQVKVMVWYRSLKNLHAFLYIKYLHTTNFEKFLLTNCVRH